MKQRVLLLGASGFIGSAVLSRLLQENYEVIALEHARRIQILDPQLTLIKGSLYSVARQLPDIKPDFIIHAARARTGRFGKLGRRIMAYSGYLANRALIKSISKSKDQIRLIYISGSLMYGSKKGELITEDFPLSPTSFAKQYVLAERPFLKEVSKTNPCILMLRVPWIIGNGSWFRWNYLDVIAKKKFVPIYGDGRNAMTFLDVKDLSLVIEKLITHWRSGVLNLFNPNYLEQGSWAKLLSEKTGYPVRNLGAEEWSSLPDAVRAAFTSEIKLGSKYPPASELFGFSFQSIKDSIEVHTSSLFKNEKGVLTKTP